jgi:hypothetical protein
VTLSDCPNRLAPAGDQVWRVIRAALDAEAGYLPVTGGAQDQAGAFMQGWRFIRGELERRRARAYEEAVRTALRKWQPGS